MSSALSTADLFFIQEFAKLSLNVDGSLDTYHFKKNVQSILHNVHNAQRNQERIKANSRPPVKDLRSEKNALLNRYFDEEFGKLRRGSTPREPAPVLARTERPRRRGSTDSTGSNWQEHCPEESKIDNSFLLYTSEAYLALDE